MAFARIFSLLLAISASQAFNQLLWQYLRRQRLSVSKIDALFSLSTGPLKLYRLDILRRVPVLWIFGLFFPLIPIITTIFPTGALIVDLHPYPQTNLIEVPTLDIDYHGNGSAVAFFQDAMFTPGFDGEYRWPADRLKGLARKTLLQGAFLTQPSPCGLNCSYTLTFAAPALRCAEVTTMQNLTSADQTIAFGSMFRNLEDSDPTHYNYMGAPILSRETFLGQSAYRLFVFAVSYRAPNDDAYQFVNCVTMDAMDAKYEAEVEYKNGTQSIAVKVIDEKPLNASRLNVGELFYDLMNSEPRTDPVKYPTQYLNNTENEILELMHGTHVRAMSDAMVYCLSGYIQQYGLEGQQIADTVIHETPLAVPIRNDTNYRFIDVRLKLSPAVIEELMQNTTLSVFNDATRKTKTMVNITSYENAYIFKEPSRLIASYTALLATYLVFATLGLVALVQNGVAADSGIFLQVLCATTNGNSILNRLAKQTCLGGSVNHPQELMNLEVQFGQVKENTGLAAFGTAAEVTELKKGGSYD
ncbi:hypothetical protein CUC08_Gglean010086 [Alternaria sp. MG1]|nr:hypothetical protein CUC08_Gglean010086 [Alternaria sp. MG1]